MRRETLLKKEFKRSDVQRVRNLVKGNYTEGVRTGVGYTKKETFYKEGDIWEEEGKTWTIKNGIRRNIPKLQKAKELVKIPLKCPKCGGPMKHWLAKKMYKIHGFCFDPCTVEMEAGLRKAGLYQQYEKRMIEGNLKALAKDIEEWIESMEVTAKKGYVTEQGDVEEWKGGSKIREKRLEEVQEFLQYLTNKLE